MSLVFELEDQAKNDFGVLSNIIQPLILILLSNFHSISIDP